MKSKAFADYVRSLAVRAKAGGLEAVRTLAALAIAIS